jgi:hypothetical protein
MDSEITGITVSYNTRDLLERAFFSVRRSHPAMPIIIIDGSDPRDPCAAYAQSRAGSLTAVFCLGKNIGHGRGMAMGIDQAKTDLALIFDTDIEMLKSPIEAMAAMMEADTYGVGYLEKTGLDGYEYGAHAHHRGQPWMPYLHPYFQLISIPNYRKFYPYIHHGAPCYLAMLDIFKHGLSGKILKEFPGLGHSSGKGWNWTGAPREFIRHDTRGTRQMRVQHRQPEIEGQWELNRGQV